MRIIKNSIFLLLFFSLSAFAQENDFQTWYSVSLKKKIIKKTDLTVKTGLRLRENSSLYAKQFTDVKIKRKYSKRISYAVGYRYINRWDITLKISNQNRWFESRFPQSEMVKKSDFERELAAKQLGENIEMARKMQEASQANVLNIGEQAGRDMGTLLNSRYQYF